MNAKAQKFTQTALLIIVAALPTVTQAQAPDLDLRLPWDIDANSTFYDGKTSTTVFNTLRFSQGDISIEADEGRTTTRENDVGTWQFSGNVVINVRNGHIECDKAVLNFEKNELSIATVTGSPATFQLLRADTDDATVASAGKLQYDVRNGVIEFSESASITEGGNQISSNFLVYNILEQRISADSNGDASERVRITYTPTDTDEPVDEQSNDPQFDDNRQ